MCAAYLEAVYAKALAELSAADRALLAHHCLAPRQKLDGATWVLDTVWGGHRRCVELANPNRNEEVEVRAWLQELLAMAKELDDNAE